MSLIAMKYVSEMPVIQAPHSNSSADRLTVGHGVLRIMNARMTNIKIVARVNRTVITPMALVSYA